MNTPKLLFLALVALGLTVPVSKALPIEGAHIVVAQDGNVIATYLGNTAAYSNDLYLSAPANGIGVIFNNHGSPIGSSVDLGFFTAGTELIFRLHVNNTGYDYYSGPGSRNPDGLAHARVDDEYSATETLVEFEDLFGTPEGVNGFNDLEFSFTNVRSTTQVPDAGSTLLLLGMACASFTFLRRKVAAYSKC